MRLKRLDEKLSILKYFEPTKTKVREIALVEAEASNNQVGIEYLLSIGNHVSK